MTCATDGEKDGPLKFVPAHSQVGSSAFFAEQATSHAIIVPLREHERFIALERFLHLPV